MKLTTLALTGVLLAGTPAAATVYDCTITRASGHAPMTPKTIRFELTDGGVTVRDNVMKGAGLWATEATLDRIVKGEQIITWKLRAIPEALMPLQRTSGTMLYRVRLGLDTATLKMTAGGVGGLANTRYLEAFGRCEIRQ